MRTFLGPACILFLSLSFGCQTASKDTSAASGDRITAEWIYGDEGNAIDRLPLVSWRADGRALWWDASHGDEATLQVFEPETGECSDLVVRRAAVASLVAASGDEDASLGVPDEVDEAGEQGLYTIAGDVYLLTFASSTFRRLTETDDDETSASFSPDSQHVAFVRANDLWTIDLATGRETQLTTDGSDTTLNGTLSWVYWEELFGRRDIGYWWSPDSKSIAYLQSDEAGVGTSHFVEFEDPYPTVIEQRYPKAGTPNPVVRVGVAPIADPATTWVEIPDEHEYVARVQWLPDGRRLSVQTMTRDLGGEAPSAGRPGPHTGDAVVP